MDPRPANGPLGDEPVEEDGWLRPAPTTPAEPRWGHPGGIQVGLHPLSGPRGLLRVFTPYLGHHRSRLLNFIAVEPIAAGETHRGFSELEHSALDDAPGKRFWSADAPGDGTPRDPREAARGVVEQVEGVETLTVWIGVESFENGAEVDIRLRFRADRPHEVELTASRRAGSAELSACVLTATMGNYARLRRLQLRDRVVGPGELWPDFDGTHFAEHAAFPLAELARDGEAVVVTATTDELNPSSAVYAPEVKPHWHYEGTRAVQGWRVERPHPELRVLVNARRVYWASEAPIPGGDSFENFEVVEPFREGAAVTFFVEPEE
jgi:hypothetical protein